MNGSEIVKRSARNDVGVISNRGKKKNIIPTKNCNELKKKKEISSAEFPTWDANFDAFQFEKKNGNLVEYRENLFYYITAEDCPGKK